MNVRELFPLNCKKEDRVSLCPEDGLEHPIVFVERFWRWRDSLVVVANRILSDRRAATDVVETCFRKACQKPPKFESDGEFGSWLLRILLDEALQARLRRRWAPKGQCHQVLARRTEQLASRRPWLDDFWCLETSA